MAPARASGPERSAAQTLADVAIAARDAERNLRTRTPASPLTHSTVLSRRYGCEVLLKCEHLLPTGSFKFRGGYTKLSGLSPEDRRRGVVAASTGNHGLALATAGRELGVPVTVHAPASASRAKLDAMAAQGATLVLHAGDPLTAELAARAAAVRDGLCYVSPYNDLDVIAGQGSLAVELLDQAERLDAVVVSVGGGGLLTGVGAVLAAQRPAVELIGAWPANAVSLLRSMEAGHAVAVDEGPTLSDATAGGVEPGAVTVGLAAALSPTCVEVAEARIAAGMRLLAEHEHWIVEGAAGLALAGLEACAGRLTGQTVAVVVCGRNITLDRFLGAIAAAD
ncbi:MAG: threonine/serine dehydratase [Alphaproteobacteria bacterium]|nr:threonine/serine dehydratase [Alphaproteobacteria bacterium]MBU1515194.1 threonine/serine dehydratase [Alphaproteobacteria bacterium]MBU2092324.1 threonine/serine dehydratase [Alphaproteobacteria bacterium]MBU2152918.1 threonine/serine dehydratase [Alphaproteobacteria bacterium]MBU2305749.1 threonine/serine dehydratase [Alphaproteobacteria bacterium]